MNFELFLYKQIIKKFSLHFLVTGIIGCLQALQAIKIAIDMKGE